MRFVFITIKQPIFIKQGNPGKVSHWSTSLSRSKLKNSIYSKIEGIHACQTNPKQQNHHFHNYLRFSRWIQLPLYLGPFWRSAFMFYHFWVELVDLVAAAMGNQALKHL